MKFHKGTLARIFIDVDYKRVFPKAPTVFEAVKATKELYIQEVEFLAFLTYLKRHIRRNGSGSNLRILLSVMTVPVTVKGTVTTELTIPEL